MERFVVKDPRVAAAYAQRRAAQNDVAAAQAAEEASRKKRQAAELGLIWPPPKRVGGKDAQGSISPLRVQMGSVRALGALSGAI